MGRRAVGGASAVGCGVFGVGGLLIGVALVVWLGSIALDGSKDAIDGGQPKATTTTGTAPKSMDFGLAVTPEDGLDDGAEVQVTGTGLPPGPIRITACLSNPTAAALAAPGGGCDEHTAIVAAVDAGGRLAATVTVKRVVTVDGTAYDCAAAPAACSLRARPLGAPGNGHGTTALRFASGLPPVDALTPPTG